VIAPGLSSDYGQRRMSDGRRFDQALRALDKFIAEQQRPAAPPAEAKQPTSSPDATQPR
jgi:hypothetical protein